MSGIFGFVHLDRRSLNPEDFQKMADEMAGWGPDGVGSATHDNAALGHALLVATHESRFEKMPCIDRDSGILFTAAARLDNRDELCDVFGIPLSEKPTTSDGRLMWQAYRKWGAESCRHLFGDWSFAAWHTKEQRLFLARDHLGNTGLFYYFKPPVVAFASGAEAILAHPEVPGVLDELHLAKNLGLDIQDADWSRTYWKDVNYLTPAHTITITAKSKNIVHYWRIEEAPPLRFGADTEYPEGLLDQYRRAVRVRLNSIRPIGSTLSAGLDSSSVTALAAEALKKDNLPLVAYTSTPMHPAEKFFPHSLTDEWPLARRAAEFYDNIEHIPIYADDITPLAAIKRGLDITHAPQRAAGNMVWIISLLEDARRRNLGVMLTGQLGNGGVSWSGGRDYIFYLFVRNSWIKGAQALTSWKRHHGCSWFRTIRNQVLRPMLSPAWSDFQRLRFVKTQTNVPRSFAGKELISRLGLNQNAKPGAPFFSPQNRIDPFTERLFTIIRNGAIVGPFWHSLGTYYGMEVRDATADVRLIEYCMGVPDEQDTFEGGQRMLIRRAMAGILPDSVRWNTVRGKQTADLAARLIDDRAGMQSALSRLESAPEIARYMDIAAVRQAWNNLQSTAGRAPAAAAQVLLRAVNMAFFLLSLSGRTEKSSKKVEAL
jgi:asparagine synthase (glutamine-hydrolysing)